MDENPTKQSIPFKYSPYLLKVLVLFVIYFITARIGLSFDAVSGFATLVWPPTGVSLAALLLFGIEFWPGIFFAAFLVNFSVGASGPVALGIGFGNTLGPLVAVYLFNKFANFNNLERLRCALTLIVVSFSTTIISATIGTSSLLLGGTISSTEYFATWRAWWVGDALGILLIGSLLLLNWRAILRSKLNYKALIHFLSIELFLILGSLIAFWGVFDYFSILIFFLIFTPLTWAALRFGQPGGVVAILTMTFIGIWGAVKSYGPFSNGLLSENLLTLQLFMGSVAVNILILGAVVSERKFDQEDLQKLNEGLEIEKEITEKQKAQYEALLSSVKDGIFAVDQAGLIIFFNKAAEEMLLWGADEVIGKNIVDFLGIEDEHAEIVIKNRPISEAIFRGKVTSESSYFYIRKNGTKFPVQLTISPILVGGEVVGAVEVFRDITIEKELDKAKSEFISVASHQLRTPVTAIKWLSELSVPFSKKLSPNEKIYFNDLTSSIERLSKLVEDLLSVSRIELGTLREERIDIELVKFINDYMKEIRSYADSKKHQVILNSQVKEAVVRIDSKMLFNVLQNLISNAIDYSPERTVVTVAVELKDDTIRVSITNKGPAIPPEEQAQLFQKFYRGESTKKMKTEGTGLGLYIVKANIEKAGGRVGLVSEKDRDTVFWFDLPLKK